MRGHLTGRPATRTLRVEPVDPRDTLQFQARPTGCAWTQAVERTLRQRTSAVLDPHAIRVTRSGLLVDVDASTDLERLQATLDAAIVTTATTGTTGQTTKVRVTELTADEGLPRFVVAESTGRRGGGGSSRSSSSSSSSYNARSSYGGGSGGGGAGGKSWKAGRDHSQQHPRREGGFRSGTSSSISSTRDPGDRRSSYQADRKTGSYHAGDRERSRGGSSSSGSNSGSNWKNNENRRPSSYRGDANSFRRSDSSDQGRSDRSPHDRSSPSSSSDGKRSSARPTAGGRFSYHK